MNAVSSASPSIFNACESGYRQFARDNCHPILGDLSERDPPVPIPNTAVKPLSPDGTARASVWESRKSPGIILKPPLNTEAFLLCRACSTVCKRPVMAAWTGVPQQCILDGERGVFRGEGDERVSRGNERGGGQRPAAPPQAFHRREASKRVVPVRGSQSRSRRVAQSAPSPRPPAAKRALDEYRGTSGERALKKLVRPSRHPIQLPLDAPPCRACARLELPCRA